MNWREVLAIGFVAGAVVACESTCEEGQEKLAECKDDVARELMKRPNWMVDYYLALPIGISDECNELDECVAECVNAADCPAIAWASVHAAQTDPNDPPPPGTGEFQVCINGCISESK